jgi:hypothetical protein
MATLREYFDADFGYAARVHVKIPAFGPDIEVALLYDFSAHISFLACYAPGGDRDLSGFVRLVEALHPGVSVELDGKVTLPSVRAFPGTLYIENANTFILRARFHGDPEWISANDIPTSSRLFIYSESRLTDREIAELKQTARHLKVQFRSIDHAEARSRAENPLAFISHDSRDKDIAKQIAIELQRLTCPVWYDEFSLKVGASLRDSIETGLKSCRKCVLVLSPHFFANHGWTRKEFDSIFTREILEKRQLVLPVWHDVTEQSVFDYSPSLLNVKGLDWNRLGKDEVCKQLFNAILDPAKPEGT